MLYYKISATLKTSFIMRKFILAYFQTKIVSREIAINFLPKNTNIIQKIQSL